MKKYYLLRVLVTALLGIALGVLLFLLRQYAAEIFDVLFIAAGLWMILFNFPPFFTSLLHIKRRGEWIVCLLSFFSILPGVFLIFTSRDVAAYFLLGFTTVLPIVRVLLIENHKKQLRIELPLALTGIAVSAASLAEEEKLVFLILSFGVIGIFSLYLLASLFYFFTYSARFAKMRREESIVSAEEKAPDKANEEEIAGK